MSPIQTGLIGYGLAGSVFHAPLLLAEPRLQLAAIATRRVEQVQRDVPAARACEVDALLDDPAIELVVIASPNASHVPLATRALRAGKHVVVDKPLAIHNAEAQQLIELAQRHDRLLSVFQNRRWDAGFLALRRAIDEGTLGEIASYEARFDRFRPQPKTGWREHDEPGAGVLYDLGAHLIDQALVLFGLPERVDADVAVQRAQAHVPDWFQLRLHYGRRRVLLGASTLMARPGPHFAVHGDRGSLLQFGLDGQEAALKSGLRPGQPGWGALAAGGSLRLFDAQGGEQDLDATRGAYEQYYRGIAASLHEGAPLPVRPEDARDTLRVIEVAMQSAEERRSVEIQP